MGNTLGRVGSNLAGVVDRIRMLSGKAEWSTHGSRALWEGKAIVPSALCLEKLRQGVPGGLQSQRVPELGPGLNSALTTWEDLLFRACLPWAPR